MAKTTLKPWLNEPIEVIIESTKPLTPDEENKVCESIRYCFLLCCLGEPEPSLSEIKEDISDVALANKLTNLNYYYY